MQREFTIQLRVDFKDKGKLPELKKTLLMAARHCKATADLLTDNPKTTNIVVFSEDFFSGREEIALLEDIIGKGLDAIDVGIPVEENSISAELAAAFEPVPYDDKEKGPR